MKSSSPCSSPLLWYSSLLAIYFSRLRLPKFHAEICSLLFPSSPVYSVTTSPSAACPFQFLVYYSVLFSFFLWGGGQSVQGLCWFIPGVDVGIPPAVCLLTCWSASPKQVWCWCLEMREPSSFLSVIWCGEALHEMGIWGVGVASSWWFFLPSMAPASQQDFWFTELMLSAFSL
jgi:hypothetical protein